MEFNKIRKFSLIHLGILTLVLFLHFNSIENGDTNVIVWETLTYLPYVFALTILNSTLLTIGLSYFETSLLKWFASILTSLVLIIWYLISGGQLEIHFWKVKQTDFLILNLIILFINVATVYFLSNHLKNEKSDRQKV